MSATTPIRTAARLASALACGAAALLADAPAARAQPPLYSERVASGLAEPVFVAAPVGDPRLFIVERAGTIRILKAGTVLATPFLDISALVSTNGAFGLFGLAFAPDYATSGLFYVYYIDHDDDSVVGRYQVSGDPDVANPVGDTVIEIRQTFLDHNGGTIAFSPRDGMLYVAPGDGGGGPFDPDERGQDPLSLLGKMIRIDVGGGMGTTYTVPPDNPFVGNAGVLDEIWAFGLRNPYRWSFDRFTGDLWIADVGQEKKEEIDVEFFPDPGGHNYGWDVMEGTECVTYDPAPAPPCNDASLTLPFYEYGHDESNPNCSGSVTGGYVYRGLDGLDIQGLYFFADYCTGRIWSLESDTVGVVDRTAELDPSTGGHSIDSIVGFGEGGAGELYLVDQDGEVFRIRSSFQVPALSPPALGALAAALAAVGAALVLARSRLRGS